MCTSIRNAVRENESTPITTKQLKFKCKISELGLKKLHFSLTMHICAGVPNELASRCRHSYKVARVCFSVGGKNSNDLIIFYCISL